MGSVKIQIITTKIHMCRVSYSMGYMNPPSPLNLNYLTPELESPLTPELESPHPWTWIPSPLNLNSPSPLNLFQNIITKTLLIQRRGGYMRLHHSENSTAFQKDASQKWQEWDEDKKLAIEEVRMDQPQLLHTHSITPSCMDCCQRMKRRMVCVHAVT